MRSSPRIAPPLSEARASSPTMRASPNGSGSTLPWSKARRRTASSPRPRICAWPTRCCEARARVQPARSVSRPAMTCMASAPGDAVILCGVRIPHTKKLSGHSDADVALHALTDALLGVIAEGDIGVHFPPSDARWRGAASELFLKHAASLVRERGGVIVHVDVTLICEAPAHRPLSRGDACGDRRHARARCRAGQHQGDHQ